MGAERKIVQNVGFRGKRHDNKILKVQISRLSFPATEPPDPRRVSEGFEKGVSEGVSEGFSKGFTRVLEGVSRGPF